MDTHRTPWTAALRLAAVFSVAAAAIAVALQAVGGVSQTVLVLGVMAIGFATSWVQTGRVGHDRRTAPIAAHHTAPRVVTHVALRRSVG